MVSSYDTPTVQYACSLTIALVILTSHMLRLAAHFTAFTAFIKDHVSTRHTECQSLVLLCT